MGRSISTLAGALAFALTAVADPAAAADKVKVGFIATFSGPLGLVGQHMYDGFLLGVDFPDVDPRRT